MGRGRRRDGRDRICAAIPLYYRPIIGAGQMETLRTRALGKARQLWAGIPATWDPRRQRDPHVLHLGRRAYCRRVSLQGRELLMKTFARTADGRRSYAREKLANERFQHYKWMPQWLSAGHRWYTRELFPEETRLARYAARLGREDRINVAVQILDVVLDLYCAGFAHRDFHCGNIYCVDGQPKLVDFETLIEYPRRMLPPFVESYDVIGHGLESPYATHHAGFASEHQAAITKLLRIPFEEIWTRYRERNVSKLKDSLREASLSFTTVRQSGRHACKAQRIYSAFALPRFVVTRDEAQRNCARRYQSFRVADGDLRGKTLLDLGSNIGGMVFEAQRMEPRTSLGVEYDAEKVQVARRVAALNDLPNVQFDCTDIDRATIESLGGPYDVTLCLAVDGHVRKRERMYRLLGKITRDTLLFEGNSRTDHAYVCRRLRASGFRQVQYLGVCDDDCLPSNNVRPLIRATK